MTDVFLSASIPLPTRDPQFFGTVDVLAIREAIKALVEFVLPHGTITFGGHPAITPLVALYVRDAGLDARRVIVFQTSYFEGSLPTQLGEFVDVRFTKSVKGDKEQSLSRMRKDMIKSRGFNAAVVIGGMEGIFEELSIFRRLHPNAKLFPVASTGAAAKIVFDQGNFPVELATELTYPTLFRRMLGPTKPSTMSS